MEFGAGMHALFCFNYFDYFAYYFTFFIHNLFPIYFLNLKFIEQKSCQANAYFCISE